MNEQQAFHKKDEDRPVKLRFFDISTGDALLHEAFHKDDARSLKLKALSNLGITPKEDEKPLTAWLRVMAEENGLPVTVPADRALVDAILYSSAQKFLWFLA